MEARGAIFGGVKDRGPETDLKITSKTDPPNGPKRVPRRSSNRAQIDFKTELKIASKSKQENNVFSVT